MSRRLALALLLACPMALWPIAASAQDGRADPARNSDVANQEEILDRLEELVASITEAGIIAFDGISYPLIVLKGGDEPGMAVFERLRACAWRRAPPHPLRRRDPPPG